MSSFDHWTKTQVSQHQLSADFQDAVLLKVPGYPRNNSIFRFVSGMVFAGRFLIAGLTGQRPSQIIVACPGLLIIIVALLLKLRYRCKVCVDVRDDWPGTLSGFFPSPLRPAAKAGFTWLLGVLLRFADQALVPSESLRLLSSRLTNRTVIKVPFLLDSRLVPPIGAHEGRDMMFLGSLNSFFDYDVFEEAAAYCKANGLIFHVMGDGDQLETLRTRLSGLDQVRIHGHVTYDVALAISRDCRIGLYPYVRNMGFDNHETNKLTDYLVMGLTVFSSVDLPIDPTYWRQFPSYPMPDFAKLPSKADVRDYSLEQFVGSYLDRFIAAGILQPTSG